MPVCIHIHESVTVKGSIDKTQRGGFRKREPGMTETDSTVTSDSETGAVSEIVAVASLEKLERSHATTVTQIPWHHEVPRGGYK